MRLKYLLFTVIVASQAIYAQFEEPQIKGEDFEKLRVDVGGDFALQFQALDHEADSALIPLGAGFNLPTANFNINAFLAPGIKVNLTTYLSSRHHNEAWVKGGYLVLDELPFLKSEGIDRIMDYLTLTVGDMEVNYGDAHFRRTDNGHAITNPFVGNYILDAFSTQIALEALFRNKGLLLMAAVSTGSLKPALTGFNANTGTYTAFDTHKELAFYWKAGYDNQLSDDFRLRLTLSGYHSPDNHSGAMYNSDRAGSRYYLVMNKITNTAADVDITKNHLSGNFGPGTVIKDNSLMLNLFSKFKGLEVFGTWEMFRGKLPSEADSEFNQYAIEGLYRFGGEEQFYGGLRYNLVDNNLDQKVNRFQIAAGWFLLKQIVLKLEYVNQNYEGFTFGPTSLGEGDAGFNGVMFEAAISF
ncbi:MAG TPA: hypothetical protein VHI78_06585 [Bacteroidales bacterium]|jgi:hypothetical protein|nr:hypothetical protein [Bacteroidales bacterium]